MIQRIMPAVKGVARPIRSTLKETSLNLKVLAGSSMSGWHGPSFTPTDMIIPGGLTYPEKAYYLLRGKLPSSVYDRWVHRSADYVPQDGDEVVTINRADNYIGSIVEGPRNLITGESISETVPDDSLAQDLAEECGGVASISDSDVNDDDWEMSKFEIWKHLAGFPD